MFWPQFVDVRQGTKVTAKKESSQDTFCLPVLGVISEKKLGGENLCVRVGSWFHYSLIDTCFGVFRPQLSALPFLSNIA